MGGARIKSDPTGTAIRHMGRRPICRTSRGNAERGIAIAWIRYRTAAQMVKRAHPRNEATVTPKQQSRAFRLYMAYRTHAAEYVEIANSLGLSTGALNARMCDLRNARDAARRARRRTAANQP